MRADLQHSIESCQKTLETLEAAIDQAKQETARSDNNTEAMQRVETLTSVRGTMKQSLALFQREFEDWG
jgi:hypothetical protein